MKNDAPRGPAPLGDFERVWEEAFRKESKFKFLADARREKGEEA